MNVGQAARFNFGYSPFLYARIDGDEVPVRPIAEAAINMATSSESVVDTCFSSRDSRPNLTPEWPVEPSLTEQRAPGVVSNAAEPEDRRCVGFSARESRDELSRGAELETGDEIASPPGDGTSGEDTWESDGAEGVVVQHLELQRQSLVDNLIGMGFPVEWAIRAAERSGKNGKDAYYLAGYRPSRFARKVKVASDFRIMSTSIAHAHLASDSLPS